MIELRWYVRPGWDGPEKVLQYRQQHETTNYSTILSNGSHMREMVWSDWRDVPEVKS